MGKRTVLDADANASAGGASGSHGVKRQRIDRSPNATTAVSSARDLQKALLFDQTAAGDFRSGLALFKSFLDSILYSSDPDDLPRRRAILREYLDTQRARARDDRDHTLLPSLVQAWDFAAEVNFEPILAHVTAVLALLLKVCAAHPDLTEYGTLLAKTILQPAVARRLVRSTSAAPTKDNIIAPALRLLTELTRFNHGAHAKAVYAKRDFTLEPKILARNIALRREQSAADHLKKPSVRTTAIRYLLTHLRWQDERAKTEILANVNILRSLFDHLSSDPPFLIEEVLDVFMSHVFQDKAIARSTKSRILTGKTLSRIASLYNYTVEADALQDGQKAPDALAHGFLRTVCTNPAFGVMLPTNGLYPAASDDDDVELEDAAEYANELGPECIDFSRASNLRNIILAEFIQNQRPYASTLHQELVVDIFKACPELVADYFTKRKDFSYDPKLTSTWIGYSAFLFQTIQIPVPKYFGARRNYRENSPPMSALLQCVLPQPLSQQVLCKCINHSSDLIQLFAIRVLIAALNKLQGVLATLAHANSVKPSKRWEQVSKALVKEVSRRCPPIRIIFLALKKPDVKAMKRESITRLLRLYYEVMPQVALQEKFDVSLPLCNALVEIEGSTVLPEERAFRVMELEHWVQMARHSPAMRWWQKQKTLHYSPFVTLIKLLVSSRDRELYAGIKSLLVSTLNDQEMLQTKTVPTAIEALIASLGASPGASVPSAEVLDFLDDCCARFTKVPMKYIDDMDSLCAKDSRSMTELGPFSPLLMTLVEQWPFRGGATATSKNADAVAQWLARVLYLLKLVGEDQLLLDRVRDSLVESSASQYKEVLKDAFLWKMSKESAKDALKLATGADFSGSDRSTTSPPPPPPPAPETNQDALPTEINIDLEEPPTEDERHIGLTRWRKKDLSEALDDGDIGSLLLCLCSAHAEIRVQAMHSTRQLMLGLIRSGEHTSKETVSGGSQFQTDPKFQQLYLLLGEVLETVEGLGSEAFPHLGGVLAARCASVVADPTNLMYSKINRFLTKSPAWNVQRLLSEFWHAVVASEPEEDGNYHNEVDWYLDYLIDSLRTPADMAYFRKSNIFEQLLNYYGSRSCAASAKEKILRLLLRATHVQGSTTLVTRCGLMAWVQMQLDKHDPRHRILRTLISRVYETCDRERVQDWSGGALNEKMGRVAKVGA